MRISDWSADVCSSDLPNLLAVVASIAGNELCERYGRRKVNLSVMAASFIAAVATAASTALPFTVVIVTIAVYSAVVMGDSGSLTAGAAGAAMPGYRGDRKSTRLNSSH